MYSHLTLIEKLGRINVMNYKRFLVVVLMPIFLGACSNNQYNPYKISDYNQIKNEFAKTYNNQYIPEEGNYVFTKKMSLVEDNFVKYYSIHMIANLKFSYSDNGLYAQASQFDLFIEETNKDNNTIYIEAHYDGVNFYKHSFYVNKVLGTNGTITNEGSKSKIKRVEFSFNYSNPYNNFSKIDKKNMRGHYNSFSIELGPNINKHNLNHIYEYYYFVSWKIDNFYKRISSTNEINYDCMKIKPLSSNITYDYKSYTTYKNESNIEDISITFDTDYQLIQF